MKTLSALAIVITLLTQNAVAAYYSKSAVCTEAADKAAAAAFAEVFNVAESDFFKINDETRRCKYRNNPSREEYQYANGATKVELVINSTSEGCEVISAKVLDDIEENDDFADVEQCLP